MKLIYIFSIIQLLIIFYTIYNLIIIDKSNNKKLSFKNNIFNKMILPLIFYSATGHLILTNKVSQSIGWKKSPFQLELGFFTLALGIVGVYYSNYNYDEQVYISLSYTWIIFIILASINHIYEIIKYNNYSFNNIYPIVITGLTSSIVILNT